MLLHYVLLEEFIVYVEWEERISKE